MESRSKGVLYHNIAKPLYLQLRDIYVDLIESGELEAGDAVPSERTLTEIYDVSRVTIRKFMGIMAQEGYFLRAHGQTTRINSRKITHHLGKLVGTIEELSDSKADVIEIIPVETRFLTPNHIIRRQLHLDENAPEPSAYLFVRIVKKNGRLLVINYSYVPSEIGKIIDGLDLSRGVVFSHLESCGYKLGYGEQTITSGLCRPAEAKFLNYESGKPVLVIKRTVYLESGIPLMVETSIYRGDEYQYAIRLER